MSFSEKQMQILTFPYTSYTSLICDGAVRSGKTSVMSISFLLWAMGNFNGQNFGICGKTVISAERNVIRPLLGVKYLHEHFRLRFANHILTVSRGNKTNTFYVFGGKDESSYMLIQGVTLAGVLLDEVALMPESFVNQALARCSVEGSKYWFNCNPESPQHWFYREWVLQPEKHNALHLHFLLDDNPSLSEAKKQEYYSSYSGVFYNRYILGLWTTAEGTIYRHVADRPQDFVLDEAPTVMFATIGVDFGGNGSATAFNCTGFTPGLREIVTLREYYKKGIVSPAELERDFVDFVRDCKSRFTVSDAYCDSAEQTLIQGLRTACAKAGVGINIHNARKGEINDRIRFFCRLQATGRHKIMAGCPHTLEAFQTAVWDSKHITEDVRLDDGTYNIDSLDAQEYAVEPYMRQMLDII